MRFHVKRNSPAYPKVRDLLLGKRKDLSHDVICFLGSSGKPNKLSAIAETKDIGNALDKSQRDKYRVQHDMAHSAMK